MKIGTLVQHTRTNRTGTVVGPKIVQRSAGNAEYVRVRWDQEEGHPLPSPDGHPVAISELKEAVAS